MKPAREAMVFAPAREREEFCHVYEIERSALPPGVTASGSIWRPAGSIGWRPNPN
jgi:hypothetical protein